MFHLYEETLNNINPFKKNTVYVDEEIPDPELKKIDDINQFRNEIYINDNTDDKEYYYFYDQNRSPLGQDINQSNIQYYKIMNPYGKEHPRFNLKDFKTTEEARLKFFEDVVRDQNPPGNNKVPVPVYNFYVNGKYIGNIVEIEKSLNNTKFVNILDDKIKTYLPLGEYNNNLIEYATPPLKKGGPLSIKGGRKRKTAKNTKRKARKTRRKTTRRTRK